MCKPDVLLLLLNTALLSMPIYPIRVYPADTAAHLAPDLRKLPLPFLEQVIPARLIAAVSDKAGRRIPRGHPGALQSLGNLTKAPVTHKAVVRVSTRPKHDRPSRVNQARGLLAGHGRCGWSALRDSSCGERHCNDRERYHPTHALPPRHGMKSVM